jgi:two-component sensor histidine kinase
MIADDGVGIPEEMDWQNTDTLGLTLVTELCRQIRGTVSLERSNGTRWRMVFRREDV